ncbi:CusA/CzcA family heavy metal efflux RND transporter [Lampropedia aestuarii]|uniref:CusA/CzcA family heavy metal efflux RND transporter n=1 Tax=Lampropedia aestuarii TaxID=2562762 RepID=A0A4S5BUM6_9BURK|nr:CusA/CzcA family heavy metal efflux RND transporter [Lampropedia aestuarii]THJ36400.1 CusA/CzcA family heavy metal efflux RND transporter [Lampropedia aestuarii]
MFERIIRFAIEQRWLVMMAVVGMAIFGGYSYQRLSIDAVPDITNVQVQINTQAPGYSPLETEQRITYPIETAMAGLPNLEQTRSLSRYGLSQVTVIFKDGTDIYFARQLVNQRIQEARDSLPAAIAPTMGPISTGLGEIYLWTVEAEEGATKADGSPYTLMDLREIQDWVVKPQLRTVPGVTEINSIGGFAKEYLISPHPDKLVSYGISLDRLVTALQNNNTNVGAGFIERQGEQYLIRAPGQVQGIEDLKEVIVSTVQGQPVRIRDLAEVGLGRELRTGAATDNGREVVLGTVFMLIGENSRVVSKAVDERMQSIRNSLPEGVHIVTVYDRTNLVEKAIATVKGNLLEGAALVIVVLFLFLGNIRAALITALIIPLSMLFTFTGMVQYRISANLMSLGALDFGIIIDGAVVIVENCVRRLSHAQALKGRLLTRAERFQEVFAAAKEVRRPLLFGQLIIMVVYLPIFALTGVEGKMFHPMALTVVLALAGAMILSITFVPAAVALFIGKRVGEKENRLMGWARNAYAPLLKGVMRVPLLVIAGALVAVALSLALATRLGSEFAPNLNEGDFAVQAMRVPGTSLTQSLEMQMQLERALISEIPEIERVFARTGTAEVASDPMPPSISDGYIMLKPKNQWPNPGRSRDDLLAEIQEVAESIPGSKYEFSQPIQLRFNELISGVRSDVAVKVFGDDMQVLEGIAQNIANTLQNIAGASEVAVEQTTGLPMLTVQIDREEASRYGLNMDEVQQAIAIAIGGQEAGTLFDGDRRFDIQVRLQDDVRNDLAALERLPIALPQSADSRTGFIPLNAIAKFELAPGPNQVSREDGKRLIIVSANVRGRDVGSFVEQAQRELTTIALPSGYWTRWGGTFENLQSAQQRLQIVVPAALMLVFTLLFAMFGNVRDGLVVFTGIPFALTGGILALWMRGIPLSISAAIGFIALSGVAVLNGLVMISAIRSLRETGLSVPQAVEEGALSRLRPVLMTALVASLGFVPMAIATGTGAEVQRPLATVVIGGIISSTILTLLVLPLLYRLVHRHDPSEDAPETAPRPLAAH